MLTDKISDMEDDKIHNEEMNPEAGSAEDIPNINESGDVSATDDTSLNKPGAVTKLHGFFHALLWFLTGVLSVIFLFIFVVFLVPELQEISSVGKQMETGDPQAKQDANYKKQTGLLTRDIQRLSRKYNSYTSGQSYIVINTTENRFYLYRNKKVIREGFCSTGSLTMLKTSKGKVWVFKTPKGKRWIQGKITNPSWRRPDWSFIEEGSPVPAKDDPSRWESGVLGEYALAIGDGYFIHGTIYKRFLGMPVTHGCVRLNDEDLEVVYNTLNIGSKVFIF